MTLLGMQHTHIQHDGRQFLSVTSMCLIVALILSGCSVHWWVGDGRGDWSLDLINGYGIVKVNSKSIYLIYKTDPAATGGTYVISNYFVDAYQLHDPYICLRGISTQKLSATDEELSSGAFLYYVVDTETGEIFGPYQAVDSFTNVCNYLGICMIDKWKKT